MRLSYFWRHHLVLDFIAAGTFTDKILLHKCSALFCLLLVGCNHSTGPGGQRKDLPVDQRALQSWDQGKCPLGAQQKEGICAWPGSHALALLWHYSGTAAGHWGAQTLAICFICSSTPHCCCFCACVCRKLLISIRQSIPQHWQHTNRTEFVMHLLSSSV